MKTLLERWLSMLQTSHAGLSKAYLDGLRRLLSPRQPRSFGWIFHGAFAAPGYWLAVHGEVQQVGTLPN